MIPGPASIILELLYPETCLLCGAGRGQVPWMATGATRDGLRSWDRPHLCRACVMDWPTDPVTGRLEDVNFPDLPVAAGARTNPDLVKLVGCFKYHGIRGLGWPLAGMLARPLATLMDSSDPLDALVPVALHRARRRARGFNQAEILAGVAARAAGLTLLPKVLVRRRATAQQAKIDSPEQRRRNLVAAFRARGPAAGRNVVLVDDLVTTGWTVLAAAEALRASGWRVRGVLALGLAGGAKNSGGRVDTLRGGF